MHKDVNDVESTIRHNEITIHPNSNFNKITDVNIKVTILNNLIKECKSFLGRVQKFNSNIKKRKHKPDKLNDETKLLKIREDGKWKKGTTLILGDSILLGLREHKMSHRRSLKVCYFLGARIADMKYYSVPLFMKQPECIILDIGTNDAPFLTPENMFKELKGLRGFILKFLTDVKLVFSTPVIRTDKSNANENNKQFTNQKSKV